MEQSMNHHNHPAPPFLMSPGDKLFPAPGSFNFSMAALTDPNALASEFFSGMLFIHELWTTSWECAERWAVFFF